MAWCMLEMNLHGISNDGKQKAARSPGVICSLATVSRESCEGLFAVFCPPVSGCLWKDFDEPKDLELRLFYFTISMKVDASQGSNWSTYIQQRGTNAIKPSETDDLSVSGPSPKASGLNPRHRLGCSKSTSSLSMVVFGVVTGSFGLLRSKLGT